MIDGSSLAARELAGDARVWVDLNVASNRQNRGDLLAIAHTLMPRDAEITSTLGHRYFRHGQYAEALESLRQADAIRCAGDGGSRPSDLAFLTMTLRGLGMIDAARVEFDCLRVLLRTEPAISASDSAVQTLFDEAETMLIAPETAESRPSTRPSHAR